jgi:hypothetical protein
VTISNTGAQGGEICANVYVFDQFQELQACCAYLLPQTTDTLSVKTNLISTTFTGENPPAVNIDVIASTPIGGTTCDATQVTSTSLATGLIATVQQPPGSASVDFQDTALTSLQLTHMTAFCNFIQEANQAQGGGGGICGGTSLPVVQPPGITKAFGGMLPFGAEFGQPYILLNETTSLTFTIANANASALSGVGFTDPLPAGLAVANPSGLTNTCGGTAIAALGSSSVALSGGALAASSSCKLTVNVTGTATGTQNNVTGAVSSNEGGPGGTASASLTILGPVIPNAPEDTYQIGSVTNLGVSDSGVTFSNPGTQGGNVCANVYVVDPSQELVGCCAYSVPPSTADLFSVRAISNFIERLNSVEINVVTSTPIGGNTCDATNVTSARLTTGLAAAVQQPLGGVNVPFQATPISADILTHLTNFCAFISSGGGAICPGLQSASMISIVSSQVRVTETGFAVNHATKLWTATMTVTNASGVAINGPIEVVLTSLGGAGVAMTNSTGTLSGMPYITVSEGALAPGARVQVSVQFLNPNNGFITFTPVAYSGAI